MYMCIYGINQYALIWGDLILLGFFICAPLLCPLHKTAHIEKEIFFT